MAVWYSLWSFGIFFPLWYVWTKKNLATLFSSAFLKRLTRQEQFAAPRMESLVS
jgi:hypothetical protein